MLPQRKTNRYYWHNYSQQGNYFITLCTKDRRHYFGQVLDEKMYLSEYGKIADKFWNEIPKHFSNVDLDKYSIMPNHIHGILKVKNQGKDIVTYIDYSLPKGMNKNYGLISKVIRSFKEAVVKTIRKKYNDYNFGWQRSFYDRIIRDGDELNRIRQYIKENPVNWEKDRNNPENLLM